MHIDRGERSIKIGARRALLFVIVWRAAHFHDGPEIKNKIFEFKLKTRILKRKKIKRRSLLLLPLGKSEIS